jgi:hypothetical protein
LILVDFAPAICVAVRAGGTRAPSDPVLNAGTVDLYGDLTETADGFRSLTPEPPERSQIPQGQRYRQEQGKSDRDPKQDHRLCVRRFEGGFRGRVTSHLLSRLAFAEPESRSVAATNGRWAVARKGGAGPGGTQAATALPRSRVEAAQPKPERD